MAALGMELFVNAGKLRAEILGEGITNQKHILGKENNLQIVQD
jgi:hypothetical protein